MLSGSSASVTEQEVHAFVDGQLSPERAAEVALAVSQDPDLVQRVNTYREQNAALRTLMAPLLDEPVPVRLTRFATPSARFGLRNPWPLAAAASLLLGVALGGALGWYSRGESIVRGGNPISFQSQAALIHSVYSKEARHPVEVWAAEEEHLVAWLSKRVNEPLKAPKLAEFGFNLVGGRLVATHRQPTAMFMYQNAENQRLTLTVRRDVEDHRDTAFRFSAENNVAVFYWIDRDCGYALSGEIEKGQLLTIARSVYGQLATARKTP